MNKHNTKHALKLKNSWSLSVYTKLYTVFYCVNKIKTAFY